jgi:hypothetical protein
MIELFPDPTKLQKRMAKILVKLSLGEKNFMPFCDILSVPRDGKTEYYFLCFVIHKKLYWQFWEKSFFQELEKRFDRLEKFISELGESIDPKKVVDWLLRPVGFPEKMPKEYLASDEGFKQLSQIAYLLRSGQSS